MDAEQGRQVEDEGVRQGSLVQVENLVPVNVGEDDDVVVRFVSGGFVKRLQGEEARGLATTIDERKSESQLNMTSVQAVINMVDMDGTFEYESQQGPSISSVQENPSTNKLVPSLLKTQVEVGTVLRGGDRTVDVSLSPWDPSQSNQKKVSQQGTTDEMVSLSSWNSADQSSTIKTIATLNPPNVNDGVGVLGDGSAHDRPVVDKQIIDEDFDEDALNSLPAEQKEQGDEGITQGNIVEGALNSLQADEEEMGDEGSYQGSASLLDSQESQVRALQCQTFNVLT